MNRETKMPSRHYPSRDRRRSEDFAALLERAEPAFDCFYIEEPRLVFGGGFTAVDPKVGITDFGPLGTEPYSSKTVRLGIIGTGPGIDAAQAYLERSQERVTPGLNSKERHYDTLCFPDFPGARPGAGLRARFHVASTRDIPLERFERAVAGANVAGKLRAVVELLEKQLEMLKAIEPVPDVVLVVLPKCVEDECATVGSSFRHRRVPLTGTEKIARSFARESSRTGQQMLDFAFTEPEPDTTSAYWNLHHALKAHAMRHGIPTQMAWESTLRGHGLTQDPATMAWNFFTALYYKANNIPWQLEVLPENTCYVGISFFRVNPNEATLHTSLAQAFSGHGEGLVLQGPKAICDRERDPAPHLGEREAEQLLRNVLQLYADFHEMPPRRVVLHKSSRYWPEELRGFERALDGVPRHDFLTLECLGHRFYRTGNAPPVRGTVVTLAPRQHVLYTVGYVPALGAFPGARPPLPLEIIEHHGHSSADVVCREILALTKVNWNSCNFASVEPITLQFARTVGRVMRELPPDVPAARLYRFYM